MKNVLTKMGYMAIGCLLTLIGYHFGSVENNSVSAQQSSENVATDIVDRLRVRQLEIVGNDNTSRIILGANLDGAEIKFVGGEHTPLMRFYNESNTGRIEIANPSGKQLAIADRGLLIRDLRKNTETSIMLSIVEDVGPALQLKTTSKDLLKTSLNIGVTEDKPFILTDFGNNDVLSAVWTSEENNMWTSEGNKVSETYRERTIRTKSIDFDRYKQAPGNFIR